KVLRVGVAGLAGETAWTCGTSASPPCRGNPAIPETPPAASVTDGVHSATIALLGNYMASTFVGCKRSPRWDLDQRSSADFGSEPTADPTARLIEANVPNRQE